MRTDGVGGFVEEFRFSSEQEHELRDVVNGFRISVSEEQFLKFLSVLQNGLEAWIYSSHSNAVLPDEDRQAEEIQAIDRAAKGLLDSISKAHFFTHHRIKDESRYIYGALHETVVCDELLEPLENLILTTQSLIDESSGNKFPSGQQKYRMSHYLCDVVLSSLERSKVKVKFGRNPTSPFIRILATIIEMKDVINGLIAVTPATHHEVLIGFIENGKALEVAIGLSRTHETWLKRNKQN